MSTTKQDTNARRLRREQHVPAGDYLTAVFSRALLDPQDDIALFVDEDGNILAPREAARTIGIEDSTSSNTAGGALTLQGGGGSGTGAGGVAEIKGGKSGTGATGNGAAAKVTGGAAQSTNGNGGSVILTGGAKAGSGIAGVIIERSVKLLKQGAQTAKTDGATLTAAELLTGIITINAADNGADNLQLPECADLDAALPDAAADDAFDFSIINLNTNGAADATVTTNTGWTLTGEVTVESNDADRAASSGRFRARKTGTAAWTLYRLG